jgi:hypothetical protein
MKILTEDLSCIDDVSIGDEDVLIGPPGKDEVQVVALASLSNTADCECLKRWSPAGPMMVV